MNASPDRHVQLRGHQVVSHTGPSSDGRYRCLVMMLDPFDRRHGLRVFRGYGSGPGNAEHEALATALQYLDIPTASVSGSSLDRLCVTVRGRQVDIFCDAVGSGRFQAFPFLRSPDGYTVIMRFHLDEAVTGSTPSQAMTRCIQRLEEHFSHPE